MRLKRITTLCASYFLVLTLIFILPNFCPTGRAQITKKCENREVLSIKVEHELIQTAGEGNPDAQIEVHPGTNADDPIKVTVLGPMLGSMDSRNIKTDLRCSERSMVLKATITRSANFNGSVLQNQIWRPKIVLTIKPRQQNITLQAIWNMRLTNGKVVNHAETPPYPDRPYPISISKTIR